MTEREAFEHEMRKRNPCTRLLRFVTDPPDYKTPSVQAAWELWQASRAHTLEEVTPIVDRWRDVSYLKLHAGEMSAAEVRTVKAVLFAIGGRIGALAAAGGVKA